ncbi:MAG: hypothetical protein BWY31_02431 [Lentisphaerae bacterium ADurb.Bin242]|nr:MAG: hypothetical protein BWY31_02431 [Lentisphaerae bacterium ADurb.Bin242]
MNMEKNSQEETLPPDSANPVPSEKTETEQSTAESPKAPFVPDKFVPHKTKLLPNCKITGIDYQTSLAVALTEFAQHEIVGVDIDLEKKTAMPFELQWNPENCEIFCHPEQAGEFEIDLYVDVIRRERHIFPFKLTVNPDPKTLWKDIPSDPNGVYAKPDSDKMFLACGENLSIVGASRRGRSHAQEGKPRDDDFIADWDAETNCAILIAADGAGSAKFSRKGSQIATRIALEKVKAAVTPDFWMTLEPALVKWNESKDAQTEKNIQAALYKVLASAAWEAKIQIKKESQEHEARYLADYKKTEKFTPRDYATTLIITVAKKRDAGNWFAATFWIGDGGQGIYRPEAGEVLVQGIPDGGEFGGQTRFLTEDSTEVWPQDANKLIERRLRFTMVDSFKAIVLMTDGVTDPKFETDNNLVSVAKWNEFWEALVKEVPFEKRDSSVADALLKWMDFWSPGNHDDRTMMLLY